MNTHILMSKMAESIDINTEIELNQKFQFLSALIPNESIDYIRKKSLEFIGNDEAFQLFVLQLSENLQNDPIPESNDRERDFLINTSSLESLQSSLEAFVKRFKDPIEYFHNCPKGPKYKDNVLEYLKDKFRSITDERIEEIALKNDHNLLLCIQNLEDTPPDPLYFKDDPRMDEQIRKYINSSDDDFLYEVEFVEHKEKILEFMKIQQDEKEFAREKAKILGELLECECCGEDVIAEDVVTCNNGHVFCNECFERSVDVIMKDAKVEFPCFQECDGKFRMADVQKVLNPKAYNILMCRIQYREVRAADVPGMEFCPHCDYGVIPDERDKIFNCEKCFAKICRKCKKDYHYPRECNESEEEYRKTQERIQSEEQQTYKVVRICKNCNVDFIKEAGCNKMACSSCGVLMCYICQEIIQGYEHFKNGHCPLH